jgi:hypothetical protein
MLNFCFNVAIHNGRFASESSPSSLKKKKCVDETPPQLAEGSLRWRENPSKAKTTHAIRVILDNLKKRIKIS